MQKRYEDANIIVGTRNIKYFHPISDKKRRTEESK
uniref:Uncharacterized protein n=1 Tax=Lepeophtheirus salmonis TaxID=72036 RepID=A0A0K2U761_LEPSM